MSTVVVVRKNGVACIAADSLTSYGELKLSSRYDPHSEKIQTFGDTAKKLSFLISAIALLSLKPFQRYTQSSKKIIFSTPKMKKMILMSPATTLCERYTSILYSGQQAQEALMHWVQCMRCMIAMIPQSL